MTRKKGWVEALLTKRAALEKVLGVSLGAMLGCGHFGCVFASTPPWVVKFSIDPTEGPIWSKIVGLMKEERYGEGGFPEIKSITRILPDIPYGGRKKKVWAIVREGIEPVFVSDRTSLRFSPFTCAKFGFPPDLSVHGSGISMFGPNAEDFSAALNALNKYRMFAQAWHRGARSRDGSREETAELLQRVADTHFHGGACAPLGESLSMLASNGVYLRDVHMMNIGWHVAPPGAGDDWDRLVIFDPGHTPTGPAKDIPEALVANGRSAL
jgi:hypothetical protein